MLAKMNLFLHFLILLILQSHYRLKKYSETSEFRHLRVLKNLSFIKRCPLLGSNLKKIVRLGTKRFARYLWHVRYLGCPLLGGFTAFQKYQLCSSIL